MQFNSKGIRKVLKGTHNRDKINASHLEQFTVALQHLLAQMEGAASNSESEEHFKGLLNEFLKDAFYKDTNYINTKKLRGNSEIDTAIYTGKTASDKVAVLIEVKEPSKKSEMITRDNLHKKSFYEAVMYYLYEKIIFENHEIKNIIITNLTEWFVFDASEFHRLFFQDVKLKKQFIAWQKGQTDSDSTKQMYEIIAREIQDSDQQITGAFIPLANYKKHIDNDSETAQKQLTGLFKILSPRHLLKVETANDSNSLNKEFYNELLHIIGLEDVKDGGKRIIQRKKESDREFASLLENTIAKIKSRNTLSRLENLEQYGATHEEQLFSVGLELCLTWVNRILFLKLLESQLLSYHHNKPEYKFLSPDQLKEFDQLETLFFEVLAEKPDTRNAHVKERFANIPYLNSSLFEPTELEINTVYISGLKDNLELSLRPKTVLQKDSKRATGKISTLEYLLRFLDAYEFGVEGNEEIQEESKTLINASVLGLIFEKINGYKEGSFYTPGFITMYMCRETIRRAVVEKINNQLDWKCKTFDDVFNKIDADNRHTINEIINSLTICDPAVGSGHFLVSALNEIIAIKSDLKILMDKDGKRIRDYEIDIDNDELNVTDDEGNPFAYTVNENGSISNEKQRIQETLFNEKRTIIENCLFGVDINPNSVKICCLRLWIELLKHAYYTSESDFCELETLPNIDINIKEGNSLISRFNVRDSTVGINIETRNKMKIATEKYKENVILYKGTNDKYLKQQVKKSIKEIKEEFTKVSIPDDAAYKEWNKKLGELQQEQSKMIFDENERKEWGKKIETLVLEADALEKIYQEKLKKIYGNGFEWRFEFPEVLDDDGKYIGFDCIIGNPPYFSVSTDPNLKNVKNKYLTYASSGDIYALFIELSQKVLKQNGFSTLIISNKWMRANYGKALRKYLVEDTQPIDLIDFGQNLMFDSATVHTNILTIQKHTFHIKDTKKQLNAVRFPDEYFSDDTATEQFIPFIENNIIEDVEVNEGIWNVIPHHLNDIKVKAENKGKLLANWDIEFYRGILTGYNEAFILPKEIAEALLSKDPKNAEIIKPILRGRDTRRYYCNYADLWIINSHNGYKNIERINVVDDYPTIHEYLLQYKTKAKKRFDKGKHWTNLRNCAYLDKFDKPKIIFSEIVSEPQFYYDEKGYYPEATVFFISGKHLKYLTALLNSKAVTFLFKSFYMGGELVGKIRYKKAFLEKVPLPVPSETAEQDIENKVNQILTLKKSDPTTDTSALESEIDDMVYQLYDLTPEEIAIIEAAVK